MATALLPRTRRAPDETTDVRLLQDLYVRHGKHNRGDVVTVSKQLAEALIETKQAQLPDVPMPAADGEKPDADPAPAPTKAEAPHDDE